MTRKFTKYLMGASIGVALGAMPFAAQAGETLKNVKSKDSISCGVHTGLAGFAIADGQGKWSGMFVDYCRALAAAVLGDPEKVKYVPLSAQARFTALQSGEVDVLAWNTTWTLTRDASLGGHFSGVWFYDGQAFLVAKDANVGSVDELSGAAVCIQAGTTHELNAADYFRARGLTLNPVVFEGLDETAKTFFSGRCDALTLDASALSSVRLVRAQDPEAYIILPERISNEPLGPMVRRGDDEWFAITKWVLFALVDAERQKITQENAREIAHNTSDPSAKRLLGVDGDLGEKLGLSKDWALDAVKAVGNYGEIFDRNVGPGTPLALDRGQNALWTEGGVLFAPPLR